MSDTHTGSCFWAPWKLAAQVYTVTVPLGRRRRNSCLTPNDLWCKMFAGESMTIL